MNDEQCYIISYDLRNERNYDKLHDAIKEYGTWAQILESTWAIVTFDSAKQVYNKLISVLDDDDGLFIIRSGMESVWANIACRDKWLENNL